MFSDVVVERKGKKGKERKGKERKVRVEGGKRHIASIKKRLPRRKRKSPKKLILLITTLTQNTGSRRKYIGY